MMSPVFFALLAAAYLLGSLPSALLISRVAGLPDPRTYGSGNVGATNMARGKSRTAAILTLFADGGKGGVAVLAAALLLPQHPAAAAACGVLAVLGHITSPFLGFRGGRGVATTLAVYLCWQPGIGIATLGVWAAVFALCRYSSVASLTAITMASALFWFLSPPFFAAALLINVLIVIRHYDNLRRLFAGSEQQMR